MQELYRHVERMNSTSYALTQDCECTIDLHAILREKPEVRNCVFGFQRDMSELFCETYGTTDKWFWPPISPREEMSNEQALLAMVNIFEELCVIEKEDNGKYKLNENAMSRWIIQYGDVLTIKKWNALAYIIVQQMTKLGKEEYVQIMMTAYKCFYKMHDYLHENIHRLQGIFKLFYPSVMQPIQVLLGTKGLRLDCTKGSWTTAEYHTIRILNAYQRIRSKYFAKKGSREIAKK